MIFFHTNILAVDIINTMSARHQDVVLAHLLSPFEGDGVSNGLPREYFLLPSENFTVLEPFGVKVLNSDSEQNVSLSPSILPKQAGSGYVNSWANDIFFHHQILSGVLP